MQNYDKEYLNILFSLDIICFSLNELDLSSIEFDEVGFILLKNNIFILKNIQNLKLTNIIINILKYIDELDIKILIDNEKWILTEINTNYIGEKYRYIIL